MRTRVVWLLVGAALATVGILVIPAWANTLTDEKARDKAVKWAEKEYDRDATFVRRRKTRAYTSGCKRQKVEGTQDPDPHRVACQVRVAYYWENNSGYLPPLPDPVVRCVLVKKNHDSGNVKASPGGGC